MLTLDNRTETYLRANNVALEKSAIDAAKDGKTIYFLYGNESNDIVLLKNFR